MKPIVIGVGLSLALLGSPIPAAIAPNAAIAQSKTTSISDKRLRDSRLSLAQLQQLQAVGLKLVVPTYLPTGFQPVAIQSHSDQRFGPSYLIVYRNGNTCFGIEATRGGIGGIPTGIASYPVKNAALGKSTLEAYRPDGRNPVLVGDWMSRGPFYRYIGANYSFDGSAEQLSGCQDLTVKEAVRVAESLRFLEDDSAVLQPTSSTTPAVNDPNSATSTVIRYPAAADLNEFQRNLKSGSYGSGLRLSSAELKQRQAYQQTWAKVNPSGSKFVGTWVAGDRTYYVYPSKVKSRLCVVTYNGSKYEFSNAQGIAREMRYQDNQFFWIDRTDILAARDAGTGKLYPVFAAQGTPDPSRLADFNFGFNNAECTMELPGA